MNKFSDDFKFWFPPFIWISFLYTIIPYVRPIRDFLRQNTPFIFCLYIFLALSLVAIITRILIKITIRKRSTYLWLTLNAACYGLCLWIAKIPEEKIHFLEYGLLSVLLWRALRHDMKTLPTFLIAFLLTALFGWGDEVLQLFVPGRYYDSRDVLFNMIGGALGLFLVGILLWDGQKQNPQDGAGLKR